VRDRRHVCDRAHLEAGRLQGADRGFASRARATHEDSIERIPCSSAFFAVDSAVCWAAKGVDLRLPLKPCAPAEPRRSRSIDVADRDDGVVKRALDVSLPVDDVLALRRRCGLLSFGHYLPAFTFFLPATARFGPRRLRALVRVRWPARKAAAVARAR